MKVVAVHDNPARAVLDVLEAALRARGDQMPVTRSLPSTWTPTAGTHAVVQWDGTPGARPPVRFGASVRVTVWNGDPNVAEDTAIFCQALLLAYKGPRVARVLYQTGVLPGQDPDNDAPLATFTVRADMRGRRITT